MTARRPAKRIRPEQLEELDVAAHVTRQDLAPARDFWAYWGTPLLDALLNAEAEADRDR